MAPRGHGRRRAGITLTLVAIVATVALVQAQRGSSPTLDTTPTPGSTGAVSVLGETITRLPEAKAATPVTVADPRSEPPTSASSPTTPSNPRGTTTVPPPRLIPPVTVENTTTTTTTTTIPSPTTTTTPESSTTSSTEP